MTTGVVVIHGIDYLKGEKWPWSVDWITALYRN